MLPTGAIRPPPDLLLTATRFGFSGFILGIRAKNLGPLSFILPHVVTPLDVLGGASNSIDRPLPTWRTFSLLNPVV